MMLDKTYHWSGEGDPDDLRDPQNWRERRQLMGHGGRFSEIALQFMSYVNNASELTIKRLWEETHSTLNHALWTCHGHTFAPLTLLFCWDSYKLDPGLGHSWEVVWRLGIRESGWDPALIVADGKVLKINRYRHIDFLQPGTPLIESVPYPISGVSQGGQLAPPAAGS